MGICSQCFSMLNVYWKYTRKWFFAMVAGMAAIELGLLLYYLNGGYRQMYIMRYNYKTWPMEYGGALQSIRLNYIVPAFMVGIVIFLILSYFSIFNKNASKMTQRLPVSPIIQLLTQIVHSLIILLSFWLVQFLILIAGFLIYRYSAPDGLMINLQIYKIFWYPGFVARLYPFLNTKYLLTWLIWLLCLSLLPSFIAYIVRRMEGNIRGRVIKFLILLLSFLAIRSLFSEESKTIIDAVVIFLLILAMLGFLAFRGVLMEKEQM